MDIDIVYEDKSMLAVYKPIGIHTQDGIHNKESLATMVARYLGQSTPYLLNRLDTPVSGIVLFAKDKYSARLINRAIAKHSMQKYYLAIVFGIPEPKKATLEEKIVFDTRKHHAKIKDTPSAKTAILKYKFLKTLSKHSLQYFQNTYSLLDVELITGRKHQIRAQLANCGCPILYDSKYYRLIPIQDRALFKQLIKFKNDHIKLMAYKLRFNNPTDNGKELTIELPKKYIDNFTTLYL